MAGKTPPEFPAHAQPAILRIWQEAHSHSGSYDRLGYKNLYISSVVSCSNYYIVMEKCFPWSVVVFNYLCSWMWSLVRHSVRWSNSRYVQAHEMPQEFFQVHPSAEYCSLPRRTAPWKRSHMNLTNTPAVKTNKHFYFTKEVNPSWNKPPLTFSDGLSNPESTSILKMATASVVRAGSISTYKCILNRQCLYFRGTVTRQVDMFPV